MTSPVDLGSAKAVPAMMLDQDRIADTIGTLQKRIEERFPGSGLAELCSRLHVIAEHTRTRLDRVERPNMWLRAGTWMMAALVIVGVIAVIRAVFVEIPSGVDSAFAVIQVLEAGIQDVVFLGFALAFLVTVEIRLRRRRALGFIRELRAVAHIVDMHQLTKDPDRMLRPGADTASSPKRTLTKAQLGRYLDYCSELLSLTSKLAALYAERLSDAVVLQGVDEVENLTTGLSRKIWQKIVVLDTPGVGS